MTFGERLKKARTAAGLSQSELAQRAGLHYRTVQNWESGSRRPMNIDLVSRVARELNTTSDALLGETDVLLMEAAERGGSRSKRDIEELIGEVSGLFAGGELDEEEKAGVIAALNQAYWVAKENNKKYAPKKRRQDKTAEKSE